VLATVIYLEAAGYIGLHGNGLTTLKIADCQANCAIKSANIDQRIYHLVSELCSFAWRNFWRSSICDIFKTRQAMVQKHRFWAKNHCIFKATC
jgi:hypothetical protein